MNAIRVPLGEYAGTRLNSGNGVSVDCSAWLPVGEITQTLPPSRQQLVEMAIRRLSGDQIGWIACRTGGLTSRTWLPSAFITYTWELIPPAPNRMKAM